MAKVFRQETGGCTWASCRCQIGSRLPRGPQAIWWAVLRNEANGTLSRLGHWSEMRKGGARAVSHLWPGSPTLNATPEGSRAAFPVSAGVVAPPIDPDAMDWSGCADAQERSLQTLRGMASVEFGPRSSRSRDRPRTRSRLPTAWARTMQGQIVRRAARRLGRRASDTTPAMPVVVRCKRCGKALAVPPGAA